ncbi:hypothetical protein EDC04DRAFT_2572678, partial [Pisolithus marmoratus]
SVYSMVFSPDRTHITYRLQCKYKSQVDSVAFSPDGKYVCTYVNSIFFDHAIRIWDMKTGTQVGNEP